MNKGFKYKVGMYGGEFDPLHVGHIHDIVRAASLCEELYVIISWCEGRESVAKEIRYRWINEATKHLPNVKIMLLEDEATDKDEYNTDYYWEKGRDDIKALIGKKIDVVFCGSDYLGTNRFESLYEPESVVYYFDRFEVPIASTDIRDWGIKNWDYIPKVARYYYAKKVLLIGGESTGKSTLTENLALAYNTNFVSEVGRDTCARCGGEEYMTIDDMYENILRQKINVMDALNNTNRVLFVDTDSLTTKFYSNFLLANDIDKEKCNKLANAICDITKWDLVLFLEPDTEFIQDGTRNEEIEKNRVKYSNEIKKLFDEKNIKYHTIKGNYLERFDNAKDIIDKELDIDTRWNVTTNELDKKDTLKETSEKYFINKRGYYNNTNENVI